MKILVVCQHFYPENFRINDECFELAKRGHDVTVLTGLPNYPEGVIKSEYRNGKNRTQKINNVKIVRCPIIGRGSSLVKMGLNYLSFIITGCMKAKRLKDDFDVIYCFQISPITMVWPGIVAKKKNNIPLVIHCLDQWPISVTTGPISKNGLLYQLLYKISVWTYRQADLISISSKSFKKYFENELGISAEEKGLIYLPSYAESTYEDVGEEENNTFDLVFAGNIGPAQSCETIIECAKILKDYPNIVFHMVGDGLSCSACKELAQKYELNNVIFHGYHPIEEMPKYYKLADGFLITMQDNEVVNSTLPAKIQSYMLAGKPIFGAISGEVKQVVGEADCGVCVDSGNYEGLADIIRINYKDVDLLHTWGINGLTYYFSNFEKEKCMLTKENLFQYAININKQESNYNENSTD